VALIQTTLLSRIKLWGARPDLMLLVVLVWAVVRGIDEGLVWSFIGGLLIDLFSGGPLAATALALLAAALIAGQPLGLGIGSRVVRLLLLSFLGIVAYHLVLLIILGWTGHTIHWGFAWLQVAGPSTLLNVVLAPFVLQPLALLERATRQAQSPRGLRP
jgi:rod shape-determining protein MreD